jgi:error-prone DNA polymerase
MGFYAPAQLVRDAREHGVLVLGVDVNHSDYDCTLAPAALRLGLRMVKGLAASHARRIVEARRAGGRFCSIDHFHAATELSPAAVAKLCQAGACDAISGSRRAALWDALALPSERPALAMPAPPAQPSTALPPMSAAQEVEADYGTVGLSLRGHPLEFLRGALDARKIVAAARVRDLPTGAAVSVAGLVLVRQRPGAAEGVVFETLEDETGIVNLIIYPSVYEHYRPAARGAALLQADGRVQRQGKVQHVIVSGLHDLSHLLGGYALFSRDFH